MSLPSFSPAHIPSFPTGSVSLLQGRMSSTAHHPISLSSTDGPVGTRQNEATAGSKPAQEQVSRDFEALLLSLVFKAMRQTVPKSDFLGKGRNKDWYSDLFDIELAQSFTRDKGNRIGLSAHIQQDLRQVPIRYGVTPQSPRPDQQSVQGQATRGLAAPRQDPNSHPAAEPAELSKVQMALPVVGLLTSHYGVRSDPFTPAEKFHHGLDIASPIGTPIHAALPGTVTFSGWKQGYGLTLIISHAEGYTTQYSHNSENLVQVGEHINHINHKQPIALVGQSGRATGPHLHFEVKQEGKTIDPLPLIARKELV
jgi:murein DD-endopeptidase MepM/ murein hydrolase activator NlpD